MTNAALKPARRRLGATLAAAALGASMLGGCAVFSPQQTDINYQAADGVNATFGDLDLRGMVVVTDAKDAPGAIVGQLVNTGDEDLDVAFATEGSEGGTVKVPRHGSLELTKDDAVPLSKVAAAPGDMIQVVVTTQSTGQNVVNVPVLPPVQYYEGIKGSPAPSASPTSS